MLGLAKALLFLWLTYGYNTADVAGIHKGELMTPLNELIRQWHEPVYVTPIHVVWALTENDMPMCNPPFKTDEQ